NPDTLLRVCSADVLPLSGSEENILKLVHACVGKQKGGITVWNYRRAGNNAMAALLKETQKALSYFSGCSHTSICVMSFISSRIWLTSIQRSISPEYTTALPLLWTSITRASALR